MELTMKAPRRALLSAIALTFALFPLAATPATAGNYWFEDYERATWLIDEGRAVQAAALLEQVIAKHPSPIGSFRVPGNRFIDYLPYYQRARVQVMLGELGKAAHSLDIEEAFGVVRQRESNLQRLVDLRQEIDARLGTDANAQLLPIPRDDAGQTPSAEPVTARRPRRQ
jgi:hypothetical protein